MRLPHYLIYRPSGYAFRLVVPAHLRATLGRSSVKHALNTHDPRMAQAWALVLANRYRHAFQVLGSNGTMGNTDKLLRQLTGKTTAEIDEIGRVVPDDGADRRTPSFRNESQDPSQALAEALGLDADGGGKTYTLRRDPSTGQVVEMSSDGPDDHARLLEAIQATAPIRAATPAALPQLADILPKAGPPSGVQPITLEAAAEQYLTYLASKDLPPNQQKTRGARVRAVRHFLAYVRPKTTTAKASASRAKLYDIGRVECAGFHAVKSRTVLENTAGNYMLWLAGFFEWAQVSGYYPQGDNPAKGFGGQSKKNKRESRARGWEPFDQDQLRTIFSPANFERMPLAHSRWLVLLALYTGARSNELAYLELPDIRQMEGSSLWVFDFNIRGEFKSTKNEDSDRLTPIHPNLIALGLLERVEALKAQGEVRLFPETNLTVQNGPASATGKAFSRLLQQLRIKPRFGKIGIHSLRDTVIQTMDDADVPLDKQEAYCGHVISGTRSTQKTDHKEAYSSKTTRVAANLAAACHPALDWAKAGVVDVAAIRPLLFEVKTPNPRHIRRR
ncbi:site-specific integrase [Stenotrophomonas koreensis]|uniref:site-specific integrase n=1 Tax=Stenotrophomonas koreensis TaxID=266128 RepID=UPI00070DBE0B|nr:site-specific integrase [Stenotrophomonas koreensis]